MCARLMVAVVMLSSSGLWAQEVTPPPLPPPEPQPVQLPPLLVPRTIANPPLNPEPVGSDGPLAPEQGAHFVPRFGPMGHIAINSINHAWDRSVPLPGLAGTLGLRMGLLSRNELAQFNLAAGAFFGFESINFVPTLSPGVRFELMGVRGPVLIPYLSLSLFTQLLVPLPTDRIGVRAGVAFSWNLAAISQSGRFFSGWGGGGGGSSWLIIPIALAAALIAFGDVRFYVQTDPRGNVIYGLSLGVGF